MPTALARIFAGEIPADPALPILLQFGVEVVYTVLSTQARQLVGEIVANAGPDGLISVDFETAPVPSEMERRAALAQRHATSREEKALLAAHKKHAQAAGRDPLRSEVRLCQLYAGGKRAVVVDMRFVPWEVLNPIWQRTIVAHNIAFELAFLLQQGIELAAMHCTLQAVRLLCGPRSISLQDAAKHHLGIDLDKTLQKSDWGAPALSAAQLNYAALDSVAGWHLAEKVLSLLGDRTPAYELQMAAIPAAVRMQLRGVQPDLRAHSALIAGLKAALPKAFDQYFAACDALGRPDLRQNGVPTSPPQIEAVLEEILTDRDYENWERTKTRRLSTKKDHLALVAADYPLLKALLDIKHIVKQLDTYGDSWALFVNPRTGRIHPTYKVAWTASGRASCENPNLQALPGQQPIAGVASFRTLIVPRRGFTLVGADYHQMEMRAAAYISLDAAMTAALKERKDLHVITAAAMLKIAPEAVTKEQRDLAKVVNFAQLYGQRANGLTRRVRVLYGLKISRAEAEEWQISFRRAYPQVPEWGERQVRSCRATRRIPISSGRIYEFAWDEGDYHDNQALNLPIQGACADVSMRALTIIDRLLYEAGIDGGPIIWVHDELLLEVPEADAEKTTVLLQEAMVEAFLETFPDAPIEGLVEATIGQSWAEVKG